MDVYFGGTVEACAGGNKQRWRLAVFRQKFPVEGNSLALGGLKDEVRDVKYGFLLGTLLLLTALFTPVFCLVCWAVVGLKASHVVGRHVRHSFVAFVAILPFMTKKRWVVPHLPCGETLLSSGTTCRLSG